MLPNLDTHLDHVVKLETDAELRAVVNILLDAGTCFAVIGGELTIRTTERGAKALYIAGV